LLRQHRFHKGHVQTRFVEEVLLEDA
jgi:hypothetical protein